MFNLSEALVNHIQPPTLCTSPLLRCVIAWDTCRAAHCARQWCGCPSATCAWACNSFGNMACACAAHAAYWRLVSSSRQGKVLRQNAGLRTQKWFYYLLQPWSASSSLLLRLRGWLVHSSVLLGFKVCRVSVWCLLSNVAAQLIWLVPDALQVCKWYVVHSAGLL